MITIQIYFLINSNLCLHAKIRYDGLVQLECLANHGHPDVYAQVQDLLDRFFYNDKGSHAADDIEISLMSNAGK